MPGAVSVELIAHPGHCANVTFEKSMQKITIKSGVNFFMYRLVCTKIQEINRTKKYTSLLLCLYKTL